MLRTILTHGATVGLVAGAIVSLLAVTVAHDLSQGLAMAISYLVMLAALSAIFVAVKRHRDTAGGGVIGFWRAFGMGLAIALVACIAYALCWEVALMTMGGPDGFIDGYVTQLRAKGDGGDAVQQMEAMRVSYRNPLFRLPITMTEIAPVGLLVALVTAALLRNPHFLPARTESAAQ